MAEDSDAARILREREQRRAAERARIDEERHDRQLELDRIQLLGWASSSRPPVSGRPVLSPVFPSGPAPSGTSEDSASAGGRGDRPSEEPSPRAIGGALRPPSLAEFLEANPVDRFDIRALNRLHLPGLVSSAEGDPALLGAIARQAEVLMERVKHELDDPLTAGAFLREQVLRWYRESPKEPEWTRRAGEEWAGLFAETRSSGGRLAPWLNLRLWWLHEQATKARPFRHRLKRGLARDRRTEGSVTRTVSQQIRAEVAQALLDDLAAHARDRDASTPLVRLSELAVRRQVPTVNDALALLFNAPESGPFVLLHPNRYPDCDELEIRPPTPGATGAALAFSLVTGRVGRRGSGRGRSATGPASDLSPEGGDGPAPEAQEELDVSTIWEAEEVGAPDWRRIVKERRRERHRLDPPPKDCRGRAAYTALRDLLLEDPEFRPAFLSVKWRGRPSGLPLLATLLQKGTLTPEVATDHEYLEAELGDLVQGDPQWHPADGRWTAKSWTIVREGSHHDGFRFTAKRSDARSAESGN
jgi:hypothetical protein